MNTQSEGRKAMILVVDDTPENLALMGNLLMDEYRVKGATSGEKALRIAAAETPPDLILLDVMMPGMDGYEVCRRLKADAATQHIPVIFLTAKAEVADLELGFELGAADYITKPINPPVVMARVKTQLTLRQAAAFLRDQNAVLELQVAHRAQELQAIQDATIFAMASLAETRDSDTGNHIRRSQFYVQALAERLKAHERFCHHLTAPAIATLFKSAPLHDIGKVGIPDHILLKPGRLDAQEFDIMKTHAELGHDAIRQAEVRLGIALEFLACAKDIAYAHHEKWDGSGYPRGLAGDDIPVPARLMALADVYDALRCRRVYKPAMVHAAAVSVIAEGRGSHFDPDIVDAFMEIHEEFRAIAERYRDEDAAEG